MLYVIIIVHYLSYDIVIVHYEMLCSVEVRIGYLDLLIKLAIITAMLIHPSHMHTALYAVHVNAGA